MAMYVVTVIAFAIVAFAFVKVRRQRKAAGSAAR